MTVSKNISFTSFLKDFGYNNPTLTSENTFKYTINLLGQFTISSRILVEFHYLREETEIIELHKKIWNKNEANLFIVVTDNKTEIYNSKVKPREDNPTYAKIYSFQYGLKNQSSDYPEILRREKLDGGYFFDFVIEKRKKNREQEVDKDLLLNLIALREDLIQISEDNTTINLLILRCLFLKYLEDRGIYDSGYLVNILSSNQTNTLLNAFDEVAKINGDIFKYDSFSKDSISAKLLPLLKLFFETDYRSGQRFLFPYKFDLIPIQLISNVYEAFLDSAKKKGKGIYYTPKFVVDFMLSQTLVPKLKTNKNLNILDPACGSGAFLVESFKNIVEAKGVSGNFKAKIKILKEQVFGIDIDIQALQIAAFSLYLSLLENLNPAFIKKQIATQTPILPSLIGTNLIHGNALIDDDIFKNQSFDCIVANPPWGSIPKDGDEENQKERRAIGNKDKEGNNPEFKSVSDFQRSQAFLLRITRWSKKETTFCLIVNNSIFLNDKASDFRDVLSEKYSISNFYELSDLNKILFRKRTIGNINNKTIEIGASEPCAIIIFENKKQKRNQLKFITPKLTPIAEFLNIIHFSEYNIKRLNQKELSENQIIWRIFVNGGKADYKLISSLLSNINPSVEISCHSGFQPKAKMDSLGKPNLRAIIKPKDVSQYFVRENLGKFNWNQKLRRRPTSPIFSGSRIIFPVRPLKRDGCRLRAIHISKYQVFKDDMLCVLIKSIDNSSSYLPYLGILNSSLAGYFYYHISMQWGKGDMKRSTLRNVDIENLPLPKFIAGDKKAKELGELVSEIIKEKKNPFSNKINELERLIDDLVLSLYGLTEYEKALIGEFYDINLYRKGKEVNIVQFSDMETYFKKFKEVFELALESPFTLEGNYKISKNLGAFLVFEIKDKKFASNILTKSDLSDEQVFHAIKKNQLEKAFYSNKLNEQKTKLYEDDRFFIIKSSYYKDWTVRQAIDDANEEIKILTQEATNESILSKATQ